MNQIRRLLKWAGRLRLFARQGASLRDLDARLLRDIGFESRDALADAIGIRPRPHASHGLYRA
jgi:hypothetical protein